MGLPRRLRVGASKHADRQACGRSPDPQDSGKTLEWPATCQLLQHRGGNRQLSRASLAKMVKSCSQRWSDGSEAERTALPKGPGSIPSTHIVAHNPSLTPDLGDPTSSSSLCGHQTGKWCKTYMQANHAHTQNKRACSGGEEG